MMAGDYIPMCIRSVPVRNTCDTGTYSNLQQLDSHILKPTTTKPKMHHFQTVLPLENDYLMRPPKERYGKLYSLKSEREKKMERLVGTSMDDQRY